MDLFGKVKKWGINFIYSDASDAPNKTFEAINYIQFLMDDKEAKMLEASKQKFKSTENDGSNNKLKVGVR